MRKMKLNFTWRDHQQEILLSHVDFAPVKINVISNMCSMMNVWLINCHTGWSVISGISTSRKSPRLWVLALQYFPHSSNPTFTSCQDYCKSPLIKQLSPANPLSIKGNQRMYVLLAWVFNFFFPEKPFYWMKYHCFEVIGLMKGMRGQNLPHFQLEQFYGWSGSLPQGPKSGLCSCCVTK